MRIGVFTALWGNLSFEQALDTAAAAGVTAVEIGAGGYPGSPHCPVDDLLASETARSTYLDAIHSRGLMLSALSIHDNPVHPDPAVAAAADATFQKAVRLAALLNVPVINAFSGLPAGAPGDVMPNWVTCPWPPYNLEMLDYQWNQVTIPYWTKAGAFAAEHGVKVAFEMHPGMLVYNVETLLKLRAAVGPVLGCNFDPSHLWWNGVDPVAAIRALGDAIFHVHGKDVMVDHLNVAVNGCNDNKPYGEISARAWTFRSIGYGHDAKAWKDIVSALRLVGYDYVISIEHEDAMMSQAEGLAKGVALLKEAGIFESAGEMFWA
ncbi:MAG: sugar phosphate isomerase/epimerase [Anaerolineae bacterium]|nr:sugar phosphate isomerase/epimerase [Anaerolineae bacterium]MCB0244649.1 sugar phosphate isomerase/epimerase [Anaerolineae bacterium]HRX02648.1 sugar phosphate isomerase/epimerase [Anaerolineae bacterium]